MLYYLIIKWKLEGIKQNKSQLFVRDCKLLIKIGEPAIVSDQW